MDSAGAVGGLSVDLDDLWTSLKAREAPGWDRSASFLDVLVPIIIDDLEALELKATVFVVGSDAADVKRARLIRQLAAAGHEIGNHSHHHDTWLHNYSPEALEAELDLAGDAISGAVGVRPCGFRGPGFTWRSQLFQLLHDRGYFYDSSILPSFIGPVAGWYYFRGTSLTAEQRATRHRMFGRFRDGLRRNAPYRIRLSGGAGLIEIPITTVPVMRTPMHMTYLLWLAERSEKTMMVYLRSALQACRLASNPPTVVLHPTDFLGGDLAPQLAFLPSMQMPTARKRALLMRVMLEMTRYFKLSTLGARAAQFDASAALPAHVIATPGAA